MKRFSPKISLFATYAVDGIYKATWSTGVCLPIMLSNRCVYKTYPCTLCTYFCIFNKMFVGKIMSCVTFWTPLLKTSGCCIFKILFVHCFSHIVIIVWSYFWHLKTYFAMFDIIHVCIFVRFLVNHPSISYNTCIWQVHLYRYERSESNNGCQYWWRNASYSFRVSEIIIRPDLRYIRFPHSLENKNLVRRI